MTNAQQDTESLWPYSWEDFRPRPSGQANPNSSQAFSSQESRTNVPPEKVREFFRQILIQQHDVSVEEADAIASKWRYGRGTEMLHYDMATYRGIFGMEAGSLLHAYGHEKLHMASRIRRPAGSGYNGHPLRCEYCHASTKSPRSIKISVFVPEATKRLCLIQGLLANNERRACDVCSGFVGFFDRRRHCENLTYPVRE